MSSESQESTTAPTTSAADTSGATQSPNGTWREIRRSFFSGVVCFYLLGAHWLVGYYVWTKQARLGHTDLLWTIYAALLIAVATSFVAQFRRWLSVSRLDVSAVFGLLMPWLLLLVSHLSPHLVGPLQSLAHMIGA